MSRLDSVRYVPFAEEHLDEAVEIERLSFTTPWGRDAIALELDRPHTSHYVAAVLPTARLVGFAGMWVIEDEGHIGTIGVHPEFRRRGVGEGMLRWMLRRAKSLGVRQLTLEVRRSNAGAQSLYARYSFRCVGIRKGYYRDTGEDALVMLCSDIPGSAGQLTADSPAAVAGDGDVTDA